MKESSLFIKACRQIPTSRRPIWVMRQAGRYLEEYRDLRKKYSFLELCHTPELITEVTLQPIRKFQFDAAILFSDILIFFEQMGHPVNFVDGMGPIIDPPVKTIDDIQNLRIPNFPEHYSFVGKAIHMLQRELDDNTPLIGFAGSPFTLGCYLLGGKSACQFTEIRKLMFSNPDTFHQLMEPLTVAVAHFLEYQILEGVDAVQIFDSWSGILSAEDYHEFSYPYIKTILHTLSKYPVPKILFSKDGGVLIDKLVYSGANVLSLDWRVNLSDVWESYGPKTALQGNLDPVMLLGDRENLKSRITQLLDATSGIPGYIFNLGHGILPETPVSAVDLLVETVKNYRCGIPSNTNVS